MMKFFRKKRWNLSMLDVLLMIILVRIFDRMYEYFKSLI